MENIEKHNTETTAVIGIACRFPGANNYNQYWQNLERGINSISEIPLQRWEVEKYYSASPEVPNKTISKWGGLIEGMDLFDAQFFGISPREAKKNGSSTENHAGVELVLYGGCRLFTIRTVRK